MVVKVLAIIGGFLVASVGFCTVGTSYGFIGFFAIPIGIGLIIYGAKKKRN